MLSYKKMILQLAKTKAASELSGGSGFIGEELEMVARVYQKETSKVAKAVLGVYPEVMAKLAGGQ